MVTTGVSWLVQVLAGLLMTGLAAGLMVWARRGYRVGDEPRCRRCGYDLRGREDASARCPECGAGPGGGAVVYGTRRRRGGWTAVAAVMLLTGLTLAGSGATRWWARFDPWPWAPAWYVREEVTSPDAGHRAKAVAEWKRRLAAGGLGSEAVAKLTGRLLPRQADLTSPWDPAWAEVIEAGRAAGAVSDDDWKRYVNQGFAGVGVTVPRKLYRGRMLWVGVSGTPRLGAGGGGAGGGGSGGVAGGWWLTRRGEVRLMRDGREVLSVGRGSVAGSGVGSATVGIGSIGWRLAGGEMAAAADGPTEVRAVVSFEVREGRSESGPVVARFTREVTATAELTTPPAVVRVPASAEQVAAWRDSVKVEHVRRSASGRGWDVRVSSLRTPTSVRADVSLVTPDGTVQFGQYSLGTPTGAEWGGYRSVTGTATSPEPKLRFTPVADDDLDPTDDPGPGFEFEIQGPFPDGGR